MSNSYEDIVHQAISLLDDISLPDYQEIVGPHFSSSIGTHIRHIVDHFLALQEASQNTELKDEKLNYGLVNYNKRNRHADIEHCPQAAIAACKDISAWLRATCSNHLLNSRLQVRSEIDISHTKSTTCESTLERELVFVASHAIHHFALIRIIRNLQGKALPEFFGYAPATISHLTRSA